MKGRSEGAKREMIKEGGSWLKRERMIKGGE
jgi:hypothetical protein